MKIAVLNFPLDNNYGGNLQRFALVRVLQKLGHKPTHLFTKFYFQNPSFFEILKRMLYALIHYKIPSNLNPEKKERVKYENEIKSVLPFYNKYIPHTDPIDSPKKLFSYKDFDAFLVGSDQVWRRSMSSKYPFESMFFNWIENKNKLKIAYGISFGINHHEIPETELTNLSKLYNAFCAVSVRENTAIDVLSSLKWTTPKAELVLDPTLLLEKKDYLKLIHDGQTTKPRGNLFCYILDKDEKKDSLIKKIAKEKMLKPFYSYIGDKQNETIEQWLRNFSESNYIVTDSYHGCIFSIIFNKPFKFLANIRRGSSRSDDLFQLLGIDEDKQFFPWGEIQIKIQALRIQSISFLTESLSHG
jgi:hypothetical protein